MEKFQQLIVDLVVAPLLQRLLWMRTPNPKPEDETCSPEPKVLESLRSTVVRLGSSSALQVANMHILSN